MLVHLRYSFRTSSVPGDFEFFELRMHFLISASVISQFNISAPSLSKSGGVKGMSFSGSILLVAFMFLKCS